MPQLRRSLASLTSAFPARGRFVADDQETVPIGDLDGKSWMEGATTDQMRGRSVLLFTVRQLPSVLAAIQLDGVASRLVLCTSDSASHLPVIVEEAQVDLIVSDEIDNVKLGSLGVPVIPCRNKIMPHYPGTDRDIETEWVLSTSGTTGRPKLVVHTLASLSGPLKDGVAVASSAVWSTFYDVRRYGGLQILLRTLIGGGSMALSNAGEALGDFLTRLGTIGVTHISGTPSHWRRALMSPHAGAISPVYVRLSGEIADQVILDRLQSRYPEATVAHAFASTEAGLGFDVNDGLAGFPASFLPHPNENADIEMRIENDTLRIRSSRTASRCLSHELSESDGFIDTGDLVEQRGARYFFKGRKEGVINVGGQKVYPEEVENVITQHPDVLVARVRPRKSPITGSVVAADVVLRAPLSGSLFDPLVASLRELCRQALAPHKVPVTWRQIDKIDITMSGKIQRG